MAFFPDGHLNNGSTDSNWGNNLDDIDPALDDFREAMKMAEDQLKLAMSINPIYDNDASHSNNPREELGEVSTRMAKIESDSNNVVHDNDDGRQKLG